MEKDENMAEKLFLTFKRYLFKELDNFSVRYLTGTGIVFQAVNLFGSKFLIG